jgi:hypothetical protein
MWLPIPTVGRSAIVALKSGGCVLLSVLQVGAVMVVAMVVG